MARIEVDGDTLTVRLTTAEKVQALHGDVTVSRSAVRRIEVLDEPFRAKRGLRAPGFDWFRTVAVGTWRHRGGKDFVVLHQGDRAVRIELEGAPFAALLVGVDDPETVAGQLTA
jgi:hypothetical protein